jgi:lipid-A-disaccharide synthase
MRVFLSAGEASGDAYGAALAREMRRLYEPANPASLQFEGLGGPRMRAEGLTLHADTTRWGAISIAQSLAAVPRVFGGYYRAKRMLRTHPKGLFVPIDFGFANIRLARHAKNQGWKVMYFVPPGSWRRDRQGKDLPAITDAVVTPFEWSADILRKMGANAHWFGHPIKQLLRDSGVRLAPERTSIAILPGSRAHEISENLPVIAEALKGMNLPVEFALAPTVDADAFKARWSDLAGSRAEDRFTVADTAGVLSRARAGIVCSGTATLEAALCRCPMVVMYRVSKAMVLESKLIGFKRPKYIALPNILLDESIVPELVQDEATPPAVRGYLDALLIEGPAREAQLEAFGRLDQILGPNDAITRAARIGLDLVTPL